ncbi:MAG: hypothetical protein HY761_03460 [Candidatus Omnitrophica bacterium]|nr:hypothetical protein [Candidatus Omnitrophota bacterium]
MSTTLKDAVSSIKSLSVPSEPLKKVSEELLGKYEGIIPPEKSSTEFIKDLRKTMYGKVKE